MDIEVHLQQPEWEATTAKGSAAFPAIMPEHADVTGDVGASTKPLVLSHKEFDITERLICGV